MDRAHVVVWGATGYTGRLVAAALRRRGLNFAVAGRDDHRLAAVERETGAVERVAMAQGGIDGLRRLVDGRCVALGCAGPFSLVGEPLVAACARAGVHYADTTGEQSFVRRIRDRYAPAAETSGACLAPAMAFEIAPAAWAARIAAGEVADQAATIEIVYTTPPGSGARAAWSTGTLKSIQAELGVGRSVLWFRGRVVEETPCRRRLAIEIDGRSVDCVSIPAVEALVLGSLVPRGTVITYTAVGRRLARFAQGHATWLSRAARWGVSVTPYITRARRGPEGEGREAPFAILVRATSGERTMTVRLRGRDPYGLTAEVQAAFAERVLSGRPLPSGLASPADVFSDDEARTFLHRCAVTVERDPSGVYWPLANATTE